MALTRITKGVIKPNENYDTHNINSTGIVTSVGLDVNGNADISGSLSVGGVLTYEDVTSIDSVGIITARAGIDCNGDIDVDGHTNLDNVSVAGITTFNEDVTFLGTNPSTSANKVIFDKSNNHIQFFDNTKANFGQSGDLQIFHDSSNSYIENSTNSLFIRSDTLQLYKKSSSERYIVCSADAAVKLFYDNDLKLETSTKGIKVGTGVTIETNGQATFSGITTFAGNINLIGELNTDTARIRLPDGMNGAPFTGNLEFGNSRDFVVLHDGHHNYIKANNGNVYITCGGNTLATLLTSGTVLLGKDLDVDGHTNLDNVSIAGVTTMTGNLSMGETLTVSGNNPNITFTDTNSNPDYKIYGSNGAFTILDSTNSVNRFAISSDGNIAISNDLDVDGHTNLDNVSIAGIVTATEYRGGGSTGIKVTSAGKVLIGTSTQGSTSADELTIEGSGIMGLSLRSDSTTGESNVLFADGTSGSDRYTGGIQYQHQHDRFRINVNGGQLAVQINKDKSVNTYAGLSVSGIATATGADINGDLDVDGHTNLDNVSVAGISTFSGILDATNTPASIRVAQDIQHKGDADTKITFPADNMISVETAGYERFRIDNQGSVMIGGYTSFGGGNTKLQIRGASSAISDGAQIFDIASTAASNGGTRLAFGVNEDTYTWIRSYESAVGGRDLVFAVSSERFRIKTTGALGLNGENYGSSGQVLTSQGSGSAVTWTTISSDLVSDSSPQLGGRLDANGNHIWINDNQSLQFGDSTNADLYIKHSPGHGNNFIVSYNGDIEHHMSSSKKIIKGFQNSGSPYVQLYYDNSSRLTTTSTGVTLDGTGALKFPVGTTAQRPSASQGMVRYNSTTGQLEVYNGSSWNNVNSQPFQGSGGSESLSARSGYKVHTFTSPGTFTVTGDDESKVVEVLVIGGGGAGGEGGGGAGALRFSNSFPLSPGNYNVSIGGGGSGNQSSGNNGSSSSFGNITSPGGGGGGGSSRGNGNPGGSGGGCRRDNGGSRGNAAGSSGGSNNSNSPSSGWGNRGGSGQVGNWCGAGGGGGAGGVGGQGLGGSASGERGGNGGGGLSYSINGSSTTRAGGGGGGCEGSGNPSAPGRGGNPGSGGGGRGGVSNQVPGAYGATAGSSNTGGGGGGNASTSYSGGNHSGGSGIVIVAYTI